MDENKNEGLNEKSENVNIENDVNNETNKEKLALEEIKESKLIPIIATALVGIVFVAVIVLVCLSIFSTKNTFFRLVNNSFTDISKEISKFEDSVLGQLLAIDTTSKLNVDANISGEIKTDDQELKEWFQGLEKFNLTAVENIDFSNDYTDTKAKFILNGENFLEGSIIKNKNIISLNLDNITEGYITVDNNKLSDLWAKLGYNGPDSLDNSADLFKELNFSKKDINNLKNAASKFGEGFINAFDDDDFYYGEGTVDYDEGSIDCKSMDFIVSAIDLNNGIINGLEEIIGKEKYVDAIYKVVSALDKISGYEPFSREEFGVNLSEMLEQIRNLEFSEDDIGFVIRIYYKGNDVIKVEIRTEDYNAILLEFTCINNKESGYYKLFDGMILYEDKVTTIDKVTTHMLNIDYVDYETGEMLEGYGSEINITIDSRDKNVQTVNFTEKVRLVDYNADISTLDIMSVTPTVVRNYTLKGSVEGDNNLIEITMIDGDNSYTSTFSVNATIKEKASFDYATINEDENFDVTKKSDEEIIDKKNKVIANWNASLAGNKNKMQQFEMAVSMYLSLFVPMDYYGNGEDEINLEELQIVG